uniref:ubiquitin fusion degradation protein 1 homolog n=1 Tax=Erigeron canadensis TaxID=72917 RepID=UPI001CB90335|nr:ubiquitin fusion degradation protein 1 homolog [Erigeron canadensis]
MTGWDDDMITTNQAYTNRTRTVFDKCYYYRPLSYINKNNHNIDHDTGSKIIMPQSALDKLISYPEYLDYPWLFQIQNTTTGQHYSHCGVLEFTAEEGFVYLPSGMVKTLHLRECDSVNIKNIRLPKGTYIKIQPHATKFTTLSNQKAILERSLRDFACLTTGDTIVIKYGEDKYMIDIVETKPEWAVSLVDTDCEVDFLPPLDYKEPEKLHDEESKLFRGFSVVDKSLKKLMITDESTAMPVDERVEDKHSTTTEFRPFVGVSRRVDGKAPKVEHDQNKAQVNMKKSDEGFKPFTGKSYRLV